MLTNKRSLPTAPPIWNLAWGKVDNLTGARWQDEQVAIFLNGSSNRGLQVVLSPSQRFVVTGEVWLSNRQQLAQLPESGYSLPVSDLQLIARAWEHWGVETLPKLVGMFTLAVWDRERRLLWFGRDRTGSRTLYYTTKGMTRWLSSDLRSLNPYHSKELDPVALRDYLCCAFVPGDRTMWREVRELRPGTVMSLPEGKIKSYWQLQESVRAGDRPLEWHGEQLRILLAQVVQEYLPTEEPVGVFLSGGLDSSCVAALASKFHPATVHTYSLHFGENCPNELEFSSLVAQHCATEHHILEITFRQMWEKLPETMIYLDDPIGDPLTVPNLLLGQLARESVGVVLNGEGGDPCFGGPKNQPMLINQLYGTLTQQDPLQAYLLTFFKCAADLPAIPNSDGSK